MMYAPRPKFHPGPKPKRNRHVGWMVALGIVMSMVVAPAIFPDNAGASNDSSTSVQADGGCHTWIGGWVSVPTSCHPHYLPAFIRRCVFSAVGASLVAWVSDGGAVPAVGGALVGCGADTIH